MFKDKRIKKHFKIKKIHTSIKHKILKDTLKISISIANNFLNKKNFVNRNPYFIYLDMFAGAGEFEDGEKGSVLIALDTIKNHIYNKSVKNYFEKFFILAIEKDKVAYNKLENLLNQYLISETIEKILLHGDWEYYHRSLREALNKFDWGFIFADPFSTELDILKFKELLKNYKYTRMKDILIFFNLQTLKRQKGRNLESDKIRLEKTIGLPWEKINKEKDLSNAVRKGIEKNFSSIKDFTVGIAYPVEKKGTLTTMDYFYLVLLSNSFGVINEYLKTYLEILKEFQKNKTPPLFKEYSFTIEKKETLFELWKREINKFLSWKEFSIPYDKKVPTIDNLIEEINEFKRNRKIEIICDEQYIYKRNVKKGQKGELNINKISSKKDLQNITLKPISI